MVLLAIAASTLLPSNFGFGCDQYCKFLFVSASLKDLAKSVFHDISVKVFRRLDAYSSCYIEFCLFTTMLKSRLAIFFPAWRIPIVCNFMSIQSFFIEIKATSQESVSHRG